MERMTDKYWRNLDPWECCGQDYYCKRCCHDDGGRTKGCIIPQLYARLAAYEDTGLAPEEIEKAKDRVDLKFALWVSKVWGLADGRLNEILQAEKDGRLVVLPDAKYTDVDGEKALQKAMFTCGNTNNPVTRYTADAIAEKLCREAKEENQPLTLDELRGMDGEPVWVVPLSEDVKPEYALVNVANEWLATSNTDYWWFEVYGSGVIAYRRKPEETEK